VFFFAADINLTDSDCHAPKAEGYGLCWLETKPRSPIANKSLLPRLPPLFIFVQNITIFQKSNADTNFSFMEVSL
jgi:hypothetical protein